MAKGRLVILALPERGEVKGKKGFISNMTIYNTSIIQSLSDIIIIGKHFMTVTAVIFNIVMDLTSNEL